jgi:hypothetical protein
MLIFIIKRKTMKNILAENMRRFRTKNISEQNDMVSPEGTPKPTADKTISTEYYYKPGEEHAKPFSAMKLFPFSNPDASGVNKCYDVMGKPIVRFDQSTVVNFDNLTAPKVPTTWFMIYDAAGTSKRKIVGYHPTLGIITEPGTTKVLMSPGKNLNDAAVYKWLYDRSDSGGPILVGNIQRQ